MSDRAPVSERKDESMAEKRWHRPQFYRYEVSRVIRRRLPRAALNRYGWQVIGVAVVAGRYAYCVKWGWAR